MLPCLLNNYHIIGNQKLVVPSTENQFSIMEASSDEIVRPPIFSHFRTHGSRYPRARAIQHTGAPVLRARLPGKRSPAPRTAVGDSILVRHTQTSSAPQRPRARRGARSYIEVVLLDAVLSRRFPRCNFLCQLPLEVISIVGVRFANFSCPCTSSRSSTKLHFHRLPLCATRGPPLLPETSLRCYATPYSQGLAATLPCPRPGAHGPASD
jgi:hypothetical protein